jgi:hypothetical protein
MNVYFRLLGILTILFLTVLPDNSAMSQKINATVKVIRDKLQGRNLDLFEGFEQKILTYINQYDWSKSEDNTPMNVDFQIVLDKVTDEGGGKRVSASIYCSNGKELQFLDNSCTFFLQKGYSFYHDDNQIHSLLGIFDFYIYIILGDEMDTWGKFSGTAFFQKAQSLAVQASTMIAYGGWKERIERADLFLDSRYQDYRIMKDYYYEAWSNFKNGEVVTARSNMTKAIELMETIINQVYTKNHTERFIQIHYIDICKVFESSQNKTIFDRLIALNPKNKDTYLKYQSGSR